MPYPWPWQKVREWVEVKLFADPGELFVLAKSQGRPAKETAMRRRRLARLLWKLRAMRRSCPPRDHLLLRIGAAKKDTGRAYDFVPIQLPKEGAEVNRQNFSFVFLPPERSGRVTVRLLSLVHSGSA